MGDKINKLSQAIMLGSTVHRKCSHHFCKRNKDGKIYSTCALGAAFISIGIDPPDDGADPPFQRLVDRFNVDESFLNTIMEKNDEDRWSRQRIAKWLEKQGY